MCDRDKNARYEVLSLITSPKSIWPARIMNRGKSQPGSFLLPRKCPDPCQLLSRRIEIFRAMMSIGSIWNDCPCGINWTIDYKLTIDYYGYRRKQKSLSRYAVKERKYVLVWNTSKLGICARYVCTYILYLRINCARNSNNTMIYIALAPIKEHIMQ